MATINSFEDLEIWGKAQELGALIYKLADNNIKISKDFSFKDQLKRAALSISNNITEGFEYNNNNDFFRYLRISKGSCGEVRNCLLFSIRVNYCSRNEVESLIDSAKVLGCQIGSLMKYLKEKKLSKTRNTSPVTRNQ